MKDEVVRIRYAEEKDLPQLLEMSEEFISFSKYNIPFDEESSSSTLRSLINQEEDNFILVAELNDELVGMLAGRLGSFYWNYNVKRVDETFWWVKPQFHKKGIGSKLKLALNEVGRVAECSYMSMSGLITNMGITQKYIEEGFTPFETIFYKEI